MMLMFGMLAVSATLMLLTVGYKKQLR